jgi:hypothetical protein
MSVAPIGPLDYATPPIRRRRSLQWLIPSTSVWLLLTAIVVTPVLMLIWPTNTACESAAATLFAAGLLPLANTIASKLKLNTRLRWSGNVMCLVAVLVVMSAASGSPSAEFKRAFAVRPPAGVTKLRLSARYAGGPGDRVTVFHFFADQASITSIVKAKRMALDQDTLGEYAFDHDWQQFCSHAFGAVSELTGQPSPGIGKMSIVPKMSNPQLYKSNPKGNLVPESTNLLWDAATGEAFAQWNRG